MRHVYPTKEVPHLWAHQTQDNARSRGNLFFEGRTIYSYGHHYSLACLYPSKRVALFNARGASVTTSQHTSICANAIPSGWTTMYVPYPNKEQHQRDRLFRTTVSFHRANLDWLNVQVEKALRRCEKATGKYASSHMERMHARIEACRRYASAFGFKRGFYQEGDPGWETRLQKARDRASRLGARYEEARRQREEAEMRKRERDQAELDAYLPALVTAWRHHHLDPEGVSLSLLGQWKYLAPSAYLRLLAADTALVETSQGATVPLAHVHRAFIYLQKLQGETHDYLSLNARLPTIRLGHYKIDKIDAEYIHAGCHKFLWSEVYNFANFIGWVDKTSCPMCEGQTKNPVCAGCNGKGYIYVTRSNHQGSAEESRHEEAKD